MSGKRKCNLTRLCVRFAKATLKCGLLGFFLCKYSALKLINEKSESSSITNSERACSRVIKSIFFCSASFSIKRNMETSTGLPLVGRGGSDINLFYIIAKFHTTKKKKGKQQDDYVSFDFEQKTFNTLIIHNLYVLMYRRARFSEQLTNTVKWWTVNFFHIVHFMESELFPYSIYKKMWRLWIYSARTEYL